MNQSSQKSRAAKAPQRRRGRERVNSLLMGGAEVFAEQGFEAATMTEIAARAGAAIGSLYQFFPTKEQLPGELHVRLLAVLAGELDALIEECAGATPDRLTERLFVRLVAFLEANPAFTVLAERRSIDPAVKKQARQELRSKIAVLLGGLMPPVPEERRAALAAVILHLIRTAALLKGDDDRSLRSPAIAELRAMLRHHLQEISG